MWQCSDATWWPTLEAMQMVLADDQILNQCKLPNLVANLSQYLENTHKNKYKFKHKNKYNTAPKIALKLLLNFDCPHLTHSSQKNLSDPGVPGVRSMGPLV